MTSKELLSAAVVIGLFYIGGQYIAAGPQRTAVSPENTRQIQVEGTGEAHVTPEIARLTLGVTTGAQPSAKVALDMLSKKFQNVVTAVKAAGVAEKDIKTTNLAINPSYDYSNGQQTIRGYEASESVEITVRNLDSVGDVVAKATAQGVNQAGGVVFDVADPDKVREQAQAAAIADAREKASKLAKDLGVSLGSVKAFSTNQNSQPYPMLMEAKQADSGSAPAAPPVPAGTYDATVNVTITYEIR